MRKRHLLFGVLALALVGAASASAQSLPPGPVRILIPFAPGGSPDIVARMIAPQMAEKLGRAVYVENMPGAAGAIAARNVATAPPTGQTLLMTTVATHGIAPGLNPKLSYDPVKDFAPISLVANIPLILVINKDLPAKDLREFVAFLKANPDKFNFASSGAGAPLHLAGEMFKAMTGTRVTHVPYRGSGPALQDLIGGQVQMFIDSIPSSLPHVQAGTVRALGLTAAARANVLPQVPTMAEAGLPGFEAYTWNAMFAPAGTPAKVVNEINAAVVEALMRPEVKDRLAEQGYEVIGSSPEKLGDYVRSEIEKWTKVIRNAGITVDN